MWDPGGAQALLRVMNLVTACPLRCDRGKNNGSSIQELFRLWLRHPQVVQVLPLQHREFCCTVPYNHKHCWALRHP